eukprot:jgi/Botrbrau1/5620/Bobra.55_1s0009.1
MLERPHVRPRAPAHVPTRGDRYPGGRRDPAAALGAGVVSAHRPGCLDPREPFPVQGRPRADAPGDGPSRPACRVFPVRSRHRGCRGRQGTHHRAVRGAVGVLGDPNQHACGRGHAGTGRAVPPACGCNGTVQHSRVGGGAGEPSECCRADGRYPELEGPVGIRLRRRSCRSPGGGRRPRRTSHRGHCSPVHLRLRTRAREGEECH